jgi:hypothetical protein
MTALPRLSHTDMDLVRRCMLRSPISADLDALLAQPPVNRCMILAAIIVREVEKYSDLRPLLAQSNFLQHLRAEALGRQESPDQCVMLQPLLPELESRPC